MAKPQRTRRDWRNPTTGSFESYLLGGYLQQLDWVPDREPRAEFAQFHRTAQAGGTFVHVAGGVPDWRPDWADHLSGTPWQIVSLAIEMVRSIDPDAIAVIENRQAPAARRLSAEAFARRQGIAVQTINKRFDRGVRQVIAHLGEARREWQEGGPRDAD